MSKLKADSTPEEWEAYKTYMRQWYKNQSSDKKAKWIDRATKWNQLNPERREEIRREEYYRKKYRRSLEWYNETLAAQGGKCLLCGDVPKHRLNVDHCHKTGVVRGLICSPCNTALGHLENHPSLLEAIEVYLG
jgi:hypothetical protein